MNGTRGQRESLKKLVARNGNLAGELRQKGHGLEQLVTARQDIVRRTPASCSGSSSLPNHSPAEDPDTFGPPRPNRPSGPVRAARQAVGGGSQPPALLVVEVDSGAFLLLKRALWKAGATARVWWARDASEALTMLRELEAHPGKLCVLANTELPGMNGFEFLELIKAQPRKAQVKFAFLNGQEDRVMQDRAYASGAHGFFVKPSRDEELPNLARALQQFARGDTTG